MNEIFRAGQKIYNQSINGPGQMLNKKFLLSDYYEIYM